MPSRLAALTLGVSLAVAMSGRAFAQTTSIPEAKHDTSPALSTIPPPTDLQNRAMRERTEHRVKPLPRPPSAARAVRPDGARQASATRSFQATVLPGFDGIGGITGYTVQSDPPDTTAAVGRTQVVEWVNTAFAVFDKSSGALQGSILDGNMLFKGFGGDCETFNDGDPIVAYDELADRWVLSQFAVKGGERGGGTFSYCVGVSQTADARGAYNRYEFKFNDFNDYPKMGVWPDGYYVSFNMFRGNSFLGAKVCALARGPMLAGQQATMQCFDVGDQGGLLPADLDGTTPPANGTPNYVLNFDFDGTHLNLWKFHVDWANAQNSTFTKTQIAVSPFAPACDSCIAQPGRGVQLQSLGDRLMYRLAYRQFADHGSLVVNHSVSLSGGTGPTGIRWYELRNVESAPVVFQQSTFGPGNVFRWMGSVAMDKVGNMLVGYSVSSRSIKPSIAFTGRLTTDPSGTMSAEQIVLHGTGIQTEPDRWGDYANVTLDPGDDCTFYFATQYLKTSGSFNWQTRVTKFKFPNCQ